MVLRSKIRGFLHLSFVLLVRRVEHSLRSVDLTHHIPNYRDPPNHLQRFAGCSFPKILSGLLKVLLDLRWHCTGDPLHSGHRCRPGCLHLRQFFGRGGAATVVVIARVFFLGDLLFLFNDCFLVHFCDLHGYLPDNESLVLCATELLVVQEVHHGFEDVRHH